MGVRAEQKEATRLRILEVARVVVGKRGLDSSTVQMVAREVGVAKGTVFLHFPSLGALAEALLDAHLGEKLAVAYQTLPRGKALRRLAHVCECLYEGYAENPELSRQYLTHSLFHVERGGMAERRLAEFRGWVVHELRGVTGMSDEMKFMLFFSLYFGLLVAGLRETIGAEQQSAMLRAGLKQMFGGGRA